MWAIPTVLWCVQTHVLNARLKTKRARPAARAFTAPGEGGEKTGTRLNSNAAGRALVGCAQFSEKHHKALFSGLVLSYHKKIRLSTGFLKKIF